MRKRLFGSIFLTAFLTAGLTVSMLLFAFYSGLADDVRSRLRSECAFLEQAAHENGGQADEVVSLAHSYADRITLIAPTGEVLFDNRAEQDEMENHLSRPEVRQALETGTGEDDRLSETMDKRTYYAARRLADGNVLRVSSTADSALGALSAVSPWIVLVLLLTLLVASLLASWLTHVFLGPIERLDLSNPLADDAYDELSPLLRRLDRQNRKVELQLGELSRRQAEFDEITAGMDEGLVLFSEEGEALFCNRTARALFGEAGGSYLALCRETDYVRVAEAALAGESASGRLEKNGRVYALTASPVRSERQAHAAVLFSVDVTEREQAEKQRREFSANVSHELKTPLTSIMGYAEIIENGVAKPGDVSRFAGNIRTEAGRLLGLIEDILRLSRLDEAAAQEPFEPVDLRAVCESVCARLGQKAEGQAVRLCLTGEAVSVPGVRAVIGQMAFNLADNAIAYNKPGGSVTLWTGTLDGAPALRVSDTGIGIAPADQARVFERFYRVDKSRSKLTGGTGLGLSIVKHGAQMHGAVVELKSQEGEGTEVTIRFPKA
ncbi:sensor histidine kinase [Agathobaculum sp.]|uniref:sensor histidine kinase n=1 Tax=Agathobaculum sp. TaxID=2048138 RepID=UPI002A81CA75|nr:ATP-binding protein [Agathobaculum sp.]MDY3618275.1 ATP-binding protein [Agathobaculum sp.]